MGGAAVLELEAELSLGVGFRTGHFLHAGAELDENRLVSCRWLAGGAVGDGSGQTRGCRKRPHQQPRCQAEGDPLESGNQAFRAFPAIAMAADRRAEISARIAAASC